MSLKPSPCGKAIAFSRIVGVEPCKLGADETINYKKTPDWDKEVVRLTNGIGVDHVVEVGGAGTLSRSVNSARIGGRVTLIGILTSGSDFNPMSILLKPFECRASSWARARCLKT